MSRGNSGSRFLYEPFNAEAAKLETHIKVTEERWSGLENRLSRIEGSLERLEKRIWLAVYGVVGVILSRAALAFLQLS